MDAEEILKEMKSLAVDATPIIDKVEAELPKAEEAAVAAVTGAPKWLLEIGAICVLLGVAYLCWCRVTTPPPKAGAPIQAAPVVKVPKIDGPQLTKPLKVVPKAAVRHALPQVDIPAGDEVIDTADIPAAASENGVQAVVFMNTSTSTARTVYIPKPAPWFALERRNTLGIGVQAGTEGLAAAPYYRRDILRIKDLHLVGEVGGRIPLQGSLVKPEVHVQADAEWRF